MGLALFNSYIGVNNDTISIESRLNNISEKVLENNTFFLDLKQKLVIIDNKLNNKKENSGLFVSKNEYKKDINNLLKINQKLEKKIDNLIFGLKNYEPSSDIKKNLSKEVNSIVNLIVFKYQLGESVNNEIYLLENLIPKENKEIFEKLLMIEQKNFYGLQFLHEEFKLSTNNYLNSKFLNNNNIIFNFLFKIVSIKPKNLNNYQDDTLNILMQAKSFIEKEDIMSALKKIQEFNGNKKFFSKWIDQSKIYLEFMKEIQKVI